MPLSRQRQEFDYYKNNNVFEYTQRPAKVAQNPINYAKIKQFKPRTKQRKINNKGKIALAILFSLYAFGVAPFFWQKITYPILLAQTPNSSIKLSNYNYIYKPTSQYLYNSDFLNTKILVGANKKSEMQKIVLSNELSSLKNTLNKQISNYPRLSPAIFVWDMSNGNYVDINADKPYPAASIIKIPVLISLFKTIEAGKLSKTEHIPLTEYYRSSGSGYLQYKSEGYSLSVDDLARIMITDSDNSSTNMLMSAIGSMTQVNNDIKSWGLNNTHIQTWLPDLGGTNYTSPKDLAIMLANLDNESFLNIESRANIFDYMGHVKNNRLLAAGLPSNASIAHKTGDIGSALGDAGIVYAPNGRKYIVAIMVKRPHNDYSAKEFIVNASSAIYNYMANY